MSPGERAIVETTAAETASKVLNDLRGIGIAVPEEVTRTIVRNATRIAIVTAHRMLRECAENDEESE